METFTPPRPMVTSPDFTGEREAALADLASVIRNGEIDPPLMPLVRAFAGVPSCYTIQSCYGHFVHSGQPDIHNTKRLPADAPPYRKVVYRIAYMAFCIEESRRGHLLCQDLRAIARLDPDYIQFGSADWFWERTANTYAIQISPARFLTEDSCSIHMDEAFILQEVRDNCFTELMRLARSHTPQGR